LNIMEENGSILEYGESSKKKKRGFAYVNAIKYLTSNTLKV